MSVLQVCLRPTPTNRPRLAAAVYISIRRSTYKLHQQTGQGQQQLYISVFAGLFTSYINKQGKVSSSRTSRYSQVYLHATPTNRTRLAAAVHLGIRKSIYILHQQIGQGQQQPYISVFAGLLTCYTNKQNKVNSSRTSWYSQVYLHTTPTNRTRLAAAVYLGIHRSTYFLHQQRGQGQQQSHISAFPGLLTSYTNRQDKINSSRTSRYLQVYLHATPINRTRLAAAVHLGIHRSTYFLQPSMLVEYLGYTPGTFTLYTYTVSQNNIVQLLSNPTVNDLSSHLF